MYHKSHSAAAAASTTPTCSTFEGVELATVTVRSGHRHNSRHRNTIDKKHGDNNYSSTQFLHSVHATPPLQLLMITRAMVLVHTPSQIWRDNSVTMLGTGRAYAMLSVRNISILVRTTTTRLTRSCVRRACVAKRLGLRPTDID